MAAFTWTEPSFAQDDERFESWNLFLVTAPLKDRWSAYFELQPRFSLDTPANNRLLIRPALRYSLEPHITLWAGYAWAPIFQPKFRNENRLWQQFQIELNTESIAFILRTRLEQRWITDTLEPGQASWRLRQWVRQVWGTPIDSLKFTLTDEIFYNLNSVSNGPITGFDQNRLFVGGLVEIDSKSSIEAGYLHNLVWLNNGTRTNHAVYTILTLKLP